MGIVPFSTNAIVIGPGKSAGGEKIIRSYRM